MRRNGMKQKRNLWIGGTVLVVLGALGVAQASLQKAVGAQAAKQVMAPRFEVDPMWPKPLPNNMSQGQTFGVWVDKQDHVGIIPRADSLDGAEAAANQTPPTGECCKLAPPILEFDQAGNLLRSWGGQDGPGYQWPSSN